MSDFDWLFFVFLSFFHPNNIQAIKGASIELSRALSDMETEPMENASSPYSTAFAVPSACEALPRAIPLPTGLCTFANLKRIGARIEPNMPAIMTATTAIEALPPIPSVIAIATGVVTDFGRMERLNEWPKFVTLARTATLSIPTVPAKVTLAKITTACLRKKSRCL